MSSETASTHGSSDWAVQIRSLSKAYRIRQRPRKSTLLESALSRLRLLVRGQSAYERIWALRDVELDVRPGQVLGLVGPNGAGKSTLLKILSRITEPSSGEARIRGRVGSLLEVGTGFHKELTGRENIFLNGSILGMSRREIRARFDEIVDFAGIETFLDTPVKRYSSGMYVRLAFAVAAHFDPDVLIVDEVLAVGDAEFQKKCLGRMRDVRESGRTVLFVSHNMSTVLDLCTEAALFERGRIVARGDVREVIARHGDRDGRSGVFCADRGRRAGDGSVRIANFDVLEAPLHTGDPVELVFDLERTQPGVQRIELGLGLFRESGEKVLEVFSRHTAPPFSIEQGRCRLRAHLDVLPLVHGRYHLNLWVGLGSHCIDFVENAYSLTVHPGQFAGDRLVQSFGFPVALPMGWQQELGLLAESLQGDDTCSRED